MIFTNTTHTIRQVTRSPRAWLFGAVWLVSLLVLLVSDASIDPLSVAVFLVLSLLTAAITSPQPAAPAAPTERPRLWLQLGLTLLFVLLTAWNGLVFHRVLPPGAAIPLWSPLTRWLERLGGQWFGNDNYVANPVTYVVIPLLVLVLAGASLRGLGFGRGRYIRRVLLLWSILPVLVFAYALLTGQLTLTRLLGRFLSNALNNGFFEEFLFRGALQTRLRSLTTPGWALVLQALVFGAWHLGLGYSNTGHAGLLPALASILFHLAVVGLAYGLIFERTGNLLVSSIVHVLFDSTG